MIYFKNRIDAGLQLSAKLRGFQNDPAIVLAVPRGGVPVAFAVARELGFPLELILTKKIGHPMNKEYAIGAASINDYFIVPHADVSDEYLHTEVEQVQTKLKEMYVKFMGNEKPEDLKGKTVIVIDDGIATGNTLLATVKVLRKSKPAKIIIAAPVATANSVQKLSQHADQVITVIIPGEFYGVGAFYEDFEQVNDEEVKYYIEKLREWKKAG